MIKQASVLLAAGLLTAGVTVASAQTMSQPNSNMNTTSKNTLNLTSSQQKTAWNDLHSQANEQSGPSNFTAKKGEMLPSSVTITPVPSKAQAAVQKLRPYDYAMLNHKIVIVNPINRKIVDVVKS